MVVQMVCKCEGKYRIKIEVVFVTMLHNWRSVTLPRCSLGNDSKDDATGVWRENAERHGGGRGLGSYLLLSLL